MLKFLCHIIRISIHAPTRGATVINILFSDIIKFQSTLLQEERQVSRKACKEVKNFNPRSYKRSDLHFHVGIDNVIRISIHAPTRGATW